MGNPRKRISMDKDPSSEGTGSNEAPHSKPPADPVSPTMIKVKITDIEPYDKDLRVERNDKFEQIKESIRSRGLDQAFNITRRPGANNYTVARGGNTRLVALKELHAEAKGPTFLWQELTFIPWDGELTAIVGHLVENDMRSDFTFYERARGVAMIRDELAAANGKPPSLNELGDYLAGQGYKLDRSTLSRMLYTTTTLAPLLPQALRSGLGEKNIRTIRKTIKDAELVLVHAGARDSGRNKVLIDASIEQSDSEDWSVTRLLKSLETQLAAEVQQPKHKVAHALSESMTDDALDSLFSGEEHDQSSTSREKATKSAISSTSPKAANDALPATLQERRAQHYSHAVALARQVEIDELVLPFTEAGFGYIVQDVPSFVQIEQLAAAEPNAALRVKAVWFHLVNLSGVLRAFEDEQLARAMVSLLPEDSMLNAALQMQSTEALSDVTDVLTSPGLWAQHLLAVLTDEEWNVLKKLEGSYRVLAGERELSADNWEFKGQTEV